MIRTTESLGLVVAPPMSWPVLAPIFTFLVVYFLVFKNTPPGAYALDQQDAGSGANRGRGTFEPHNKNYMELAKLVIGLGSASIGAVAVFFFRNDSSAQGLQHHIAWPLISFVASVVYGVAFIGMLVWRYERYCHRSETIQGHGMRSFCRWASPC